MKILPVGGEFFREDGKTDRHDGSNSRFSHFSKAPKKVKIFNTVGKICILSNKFLPYIMCLN